MPVRQQGRHESHSGDMTGNLGYEGREFPVSHIASGPVTHDLVKYQNRTFDPFG